MGKSMTNLPHAVQIRGHDGLSQAQKSLAAMTPEAISTTCREKEINVGGQTRDAEIPTKMTKGIFVEGLVEDYEEDGDEASDPPSRSFL
ncbi:hypothetical protein EV2_035284 [Malus domestica]